MPKLLEYLYFITAIIEIYAEATQNETVKFFSKPLLMILLLTFYIQSVSGKWNRLHRFLAVSLVFSWVGDVALMFVPGSANDVSIMGITKNPNYFLLGLAGFLFAHMLYAISFANVSDKSKTPILRTRVWVVIPLVIYMLVLLEALIPAISADPLTKPFLGPVVIYSLAIATMVAFALNRFGRVNNRSFVQVFCGALLFMLSDSIIAINKFIHPFAAAGIFIMVLYLAGQYLIVKGAIAQFQENQPSSS